MQSELRIGNSRAKALANIATKAQQRHQLSNQSIAPRADSRAFTQPNKAAVHRPPALPKYTYKAKYPHRQVSYIWANAGWNTQRPGADLQALQQLAHSPVLGFDMEWRPTFVKGQPVNPVALIQLAGENDIALVHVHALGCIPEVLQDILRSPDILKTDDAKKLEKDWQVEVVNVLDLSELARKVDNSWEKLDQEAREAREAARIEQITKAILAGASAPVSEEELQRLLREKEEEKAKSAKPSTSKSRLISLARLATRYLSLNLVKGKMSMSNWENHLFDGQITYAANDAAVAYDIYQQLHGIEIGEASLPS